MSEDMYISKAISSQEEKRSLSAEGNSGVEIKNENLN